MLPVPPRFAPGKLADSAGLWRPPSRFVADQSCASGDGAGVGRRRRAGSAQRIRCGDHSFERTCCGIGGRSHRRCTHATFPGSGDRSARDRSRSRGEHRPHCRCRSWSGGAGHDGARLARRQGGCRGPLRLSGTSFHVPAGRVRCHVPQGRERVKLAVILFLVVVPAAAQRAQLARKGRKPETGAAATAAPIRTLPRRPGTPAVSRPGDTLARYIEEQKRLVRERPIAEDRLRPLIKGGVAPLAAHVAQDRGLPRRRNPSLALAVPRPGDEATPVANRWRIFAPANLLNPYRRNTLKGDYPIYGRKLFFAFTGASETTFEGRRIPVPSVPSSADAGEYGFFGRGEQAAVQQNFRFAFSLFRGSAGFKPVDFEIRVTPEFNINYTRARENGLTAIDVQRGTDRTDSNVGMQELYAEKRLFAGKAFFDFTSVRAGIQRFTSDFRGLIFSDEQPGARLFGNLHDNILQYNLAYFNMLEKDTNSGLNRWRSRRQQVYAANLYWSDFLTRGYTLNFSALYNHDQPTFLIDKNGFLVRPAPAGVPLPHKVRAGYAGISGEGHIKRVNVSHSFYQALGRDDFNPIPAAKNAQHINAQLASFEAGYERDWMEIKGSVFYTSGDPNLNHGHANGFDGIVPNQQFAGGGFLGNAALADRGLINNSFAGGGTNFLNREPIPLTGSGLILFGPNSLMPTMRAGLFEGQANFVNPGILLFNVGLNAKLTPKLKSTVNINWAKFNRTEVLQALLFQSHIRHAIGLDSGLGIQYRPLLTDNIVITGGVGVLAPGGGFKDLYAGRALFSGFVNLRMVF